MNCGGPSASGSGMSYHRVGKALLVSRPGAFMRCRGVLLLGQPEPTARARNRSSPLHFSTRSAFCCSPSLQLADRDQPLGAAPDQLQLRADMLVEEVGADTQGCGRLPEGEKRCGGTERSSFFTSTPTPTWKRDEPGPETLRARSGGRATQRDRSARRVGGRSAGLASSIPANQVYPYGAVRGERNGVGGKVAGVGGKAVCSKASSNGFLGVPAALVESPDSPLQAVLVEASFERPLEGRSSKRHRRVSAITFFCSGVSRPR